MKLFINTLLYILMISCQAQKKENCLQKLEANLSPKLDEKNVLGEVINIRDSINCFDWDSLLIESGNGTKESIRKYYNVAIPYDFQNSSLDTDALIFFIKNDTVVNHIRFKTTCRRYQLCKTYDFKTLIIYNKQSIIAKKDALFEIYIQTGTDNQGNKWRVDNAIRIKN